MCRSRLHHDQSGTFTRCGGSRGRAIVARKLCYSKRHVDGERSTIKNITLPSLMFSRIVPALSSSNVGVLGKKPLFSEPQWYPLHFSAGPLIFVALLYEAIGIAISWIIKQLFWVPHRFRYGILVAGGWGNVGDVREYRSIISRALANNVPRHV